jgi:hypothetical protein
LSREDRAVPFCFLVILSSVARFSRVNRARFRWG